MFARILVPLDGSPLAESVLPAAAALGARLNAGVHLLHVLERAAPAQVHGTRHLTQADDAATYLDEVRSWLEERNVLPKLAVETATDDVASAIARYAGRASADLVLLCTHGGRGMRDVIYGRVAQRVLARSTVPVFLFPPAHGAARATPFRLSRLLLPLESNHHVERSIAPAIELARAFDALIELLTVVPTVSTMPGDRAAVSRLMPRTAAELLEQETADAVEVLANARQELTEQNVQSVAVVERGDPYTEISDALVVRHADALLMTTHGRAGLDAVWTGSLAARILATAPKPILLVRIPADA